MFYTYTIKDLERGVRTPANKVPPGYLCMIPESGGEVVKTTRVLQKSEGGHGPVEWVEFKTIKPVPVDGWELVEPLHRTDKLPDSLPHSFVMACTCEDWLNRRCVKLDDSLPSSVAVPIDNGKQRIVYSGRDYVEISGTGTAIYLVVRQWVEDKAEAKFKEIITQAPAWKSAVEHATKLFEPFTHPDLPGSQDALVKAIPVSTGCAKEHIYVTGISLEHILSSRNLPDTPGTCDCLFAEAFNRMCERNGVKPTPHKFSPTCGLLVETLFVAPCPIDEDGQTSASILPPDDALGSVISSVVVPAQWAGSAWNRVGTIIDQHKNWWAKFDHTQLLNIKIERERGRPKGSQNNDLSAALANDVARGLLSESEAIDKAFEAERKAFQGTDEEKLKLFTPTYKANSLTESFKKRVERARKYMSDI